MNAILFFFCLLSQLQNTAKMFTIAFKKNQKTKIEEINKIKKESALVLLTLNCSKVMVRSDILLHMNTA